MVDSQAFQMMSVSEGLVRAVWRARRGIWTISRSPPGWQNDLRTPPWGGFRG